MTGDREVQDRGFALRRHAVSSNLLAELLRVVVSGQESSADRPAAHALRNVLWDRDGVASALTRLGVDAIATGVLGGPAFAINAIYFDKTSGANWKVPCHQDLVMPVDTKVDEPGF